MLDSAIFTFVRTLGRALPLGAMQALLTFAAGCRALPAAIVRAGNNPPAAFPPLGPRQPRLASVAPRVRTIVNKFALLWSDEFSGPRWTGRIEAGELERLVAMAADRPLVLATLHYDAYLLLPAVLRANGLPTATLISTAYWPVNTWRRRRAALTLRPGLPAYFRAGDARSALRYLLPGRCLLVAPDYPLGDQVHVPVGDATLAISTPPLRLAALADAAVVPVLMSSDGIWRFRLHVGEPVPEALLRERDYAAAASHVVEQLLPVAAQQPTHVLGPMARAFSSGATS